MELENSHSDPLLRPHLARFRRRVIAQHPFKVLQVLPDPQSISLVITPYPKFVHQEFEEYLKCGMLEHGFLRAKCDGCRHEHLVAFSCKRRGFCPSPPTTVELTALLDSLSRRIVRLHERQGLLVVDPEDPGKLIREIRGYFALAL